MTKKKIPEWSSYFDEPHEIVGWLGALFILGAYASSSFSWIEPESYTFQLLNLFGATGMLWNGFVNKAYPSFILNGIWALLGLAMLIKLSL